MVLINNLIKYMNSTLLDNKEKRKILAIVIVVLLTLAFFLVINTFNALKENRYIGQDIAPQVTMSFQGRGEVVAIPDVARFSFGVTEEGETVDEAQQMVQEKMSRIMDHLREQEVEEEKITTTGYSVRPRYEYREPATERRASSRGERVLVGYEVDHRTRVEMEDMELAGRLLSGVGELGASDIGGLTFTIGNEEELKRQARAEAIRDAREEARILADELGVGLKRVVDFNERHSPGLPSPMSRDMATAEEMDSAGPELSPGEGKVVSEVEVVYELR